MAIYPPDPFCIGQWKSIQINQANNSFLTVFETGTGVVRVYDSTGDDAYMDPR